MIRDCKIIKELPQGGQKTVHLAKHPSAGLVVIKRGFIKSFTALERIKREVELLSELKSEYFPQQYHFNIDVKLKNLKLLKTLLKGKYLENQWKILKSQRRFFLLCIFLQLDYHLSGREILFTVI